MALTKDQYERLIAAAERIAAALEGASGDIGHIVSAIDEPPAEELTAAPEPAIEPATQAAPTESAMPPAAAATETVSEAAAAEQPATEQDTGEIPVEKLQALNEWLFQSATWLTQNGKQGVSVVSGVLAKHGASQATEIKTKSQYEGIVADVTAAMQGAGGA